MSHQDLHVLFRAAGWHSIIFVKLVSKLMAKIYNKLWLALFAFSAFYCIRGLLSILPYWLISYFPSFDRAAERQANNWSMEERQPKSKA